MAVRVYELYQKQLRQPAYTEEAPSASSHDSMLSQRLQEWYFQLYDWCGIFLIDMRGNSIDGRGVIHDDARRLSDAQRAALMSSFDEPGLRCMVVCAEIPFVGTPPPPPQPSP